MHVIICNECKKNIGKETKSLPFQFSLHQVYVFKDKVHQMDVPYHFCSLECLVKGSQAISKENHGESEYEKTVEK